MSTLSQLTIVMSESTEPGVVSSKSNSTKLDLLLSTNFQKQSSFEQIPNDVSLDYVEKGVLFRTRGTISQREILIPVAELIEYPAGLKWDIKYDNPCIMPAISSAEKTLGCQVSSINGCESINYINNNFDDSLLVGMNLSSWTNGFKTLSVEREVGSNIPKGTYKFDVYVIKVTEYYYTPFHLVTQNDVIFRRTETKRLVSCEKVSVTVSLQKGKVFNFKNPLSKLSGRKRDDVNSNDSNSDYDYEMD